MHKKYLFISLLILCYLSLTLFVASTKANYNESMVSVPYNSLKKFNVDKGLIEVGNTTFSILFWDLYKSKLLTTSGKYSDLSVEEHLIYEIQYLADISQEDLLKRTKEQWQHLGISKTRYKNFIPKLKVIWPDIKKGDTLSLLVEKNISHFYFNHIYVGSMDDEEFGQLFLDIWLAENTSQPTLRNELLGSKKS